jgi:hypothetical protein
LDGLEGGLDKAGYEPLLSGVSSAGDDELEHVVSTMEMVAPEIGTPAEVVASIGRIPMGRMTVGATGLVLGVAPGVVDAEPDAVVSSEAQ